MFFEQEMRMLFGYTIVLKEDDFPSERIKRITEEIISNKQDNSRTYEEVYTDVRNGLVLESAFMKVGGYLAKLNDQPHDPKNPDTFAWDCSFLGYKFEIKHSPKQDKWFNFNLTDEDHFLKRASLKTFLKYIDYVDYVLAGYWEKDGDVFKVRFKWLMDAPTFPKYIKESRAINGTKGTTHYYHVVNAKVNGDCISF